MKKLPSQHRLFLNRFIPATLIYLACILLLIQIDDQPLKKFLLQLGVHADSKFLSQLHQHQFDSLVPAGVFLFIAIMAVCLFFSVIRRRQLVGLSNQQEYLYKIQLLLDSTQEGIYGADYEGRCTLANKACAKLLGYDSPDELLGQSMHDLMHHTRPDGRPYPAEECSAHRMSETGVVGVIENELFWRKDGSSFPVSYSVLPMRDGNHAIGMVCSFTDITEKLQVEEQLRQAQKMEAVGQLSGGIAHDFNNILQIVSNNTRFVMDRYDKTDPLYSSLEEMLTAVERGSNLTRSMLAFSRKQFMRIRPVELNQLLSDALVLGQKLVSHPVYLEFLPCQEPLLVAADSTLMQQVLFNLLTNARDAMPDGGVITISTRLAELYPELLALHRCSHQGMFARLSIIDQGCGIPEAIRPNIFDPFFTTKEVGLGTGLGLSMVFGTVQQHGGFVTVASSPQAGTTFSVYLPLLARES
ncbi:MAG: ATP-binding protein [Desulfuromonadaceae bacterium]|nr:ATP-binding protein [Desulfuromonadaceae bacterium]